MPMSCAALTVALALSAQPLEAAIDAYEQLEFERCVTLLTPDSGETAPMALYRGLCRFNLAQASEAREDFRSALQLDPTMRLPPGASPRVVSLFEAVRAELVERGRAELAPPEVAPTTSRGVSPQPARSWVGPIALGGLGVVTAGLGTYFGLQARAHESAANGAALVAEADRHAQQAYQWSTAANVSWACAAVSLTAALVWLLLGLW
jgi:hypothetical protein